MYNTLIRNIFRFVILFVMQILVFDNLRFGNYIHLNIYVLFIMLLPFAVSRTQLILYGFLLGMIIDIFSGTPGLNAAATVFMAFFRPNIIALTSRKSDIEESEPPGR